MSRTRLTMLALPQASGMSPVPNWLSRLRFEVLLGQARGQRLVNPDLFPLDVGGLGGVQGGKQQVGVLGHITAEKVCYGDVL